MASKRAEAEKLKVGLSFNYKISYNKDKSDKEEILYRPDIAEDCG
jgi:hypothetical protein